MSNEKKLSGQTSEEQLKKWKEKFGEVFEVSVGEKICYLKKADRNIMRAALPFLEKDRIKYMELIIENCWLGGDETMKTNDDDFFAITDAVPEITSKRSAEIKKH